MLHRLVLALCAVWILSGCVSGQSSGRDHGSGSSNISQSPGGRISIRCGILPGGHVFWYKQKSGAKMEFAKDSYLTISDARYHLESDNGVFILSINPTQESDSGVYICESSSMEGARYTHTFTINIGDGNSAARAGAAVFGTIAAAAALMLA